jgi:methyl acetate hydrolase
MRHMEETTLHRRKQWILASAVVGCAGATGSIAAAQDDALQQRLDDALQATVERGDIPMAAGAITTADETIYSGAFGERELGGGDAIDIDSVFNMASMTKPITATAAMQLVEQGRLDLDSPISTWLPFAAELQVLDGFDEDGQPRLRDPEQEVTLRHLMTHTSGHAYVQWDENLKRYSEAVGGLPPLDYEDPETWMQPLMFDPGEDWQYGIAIDWIGYLVQEVSGQPLGEYMQEHIFQPLGMTSTGYGLTDEMEARRVSSHQRQEDRSLEVDGWVSDQNPPREYGGGGLYGTVPDYLRFIRMILNDGTLDGETILQPETVQEMAENQMGDIRVGMLETTNPERSQDAEFFPGLEKSWGMSFMINEEVAPTGRPAGSLAWAGLRNTFFWIDLENEIGGVFMSQLLPFVDEQVLDAFYDFETAYYEASGS